MKKRTQIYVLAALLVVLGGVLIFSGPGTPPILSAASTDERYVPIDVKDPALRLDRLERIHKLAYPGMRRDIFSGELPPPAGPKEPPRDVSPIVPVDTGPPSLVLPFKFYGIAVDPRSGKRRAFFTNGEDVMIAAEGDTVMQRFRLLRIGNSSADFEEIGTSRRATLPLEQPATSPQG